MADEGNDLKSVESSILLSQPSIKRVVPFRSLSEPRSELEQNDNYLNQFIASLDKFSSQNPIDDKTTVLQIFNNSQLISNINQCYVNCNESEKVGAFKQINSELDNMLKKLSFSKKSNCQNDFLLQINKVYANSSSIQLIKDSINIKAMLHALLTTKDYQAFTNIKIRLSNIANNMLGSSEPTLQLLGATMALLLITVSSIVYLTIGAVGLSLGLACMAAVFGGFIASLGSRHGASLALLNLITAVNTSFEAKDMLDSLTDSDIWQSLEETNSYQIVFSNQADLDIFLDKHNLVDLLEKQSKIKMSSEDIPQTSQVCLLLKNATKPNLIKLHSLQQSMQVNEAISSLDVPSMV